MPKWLLIAVALALASVLGINYCQGRSLGKLQHEEVVLEVKLPLAKEEQRKVQAHTDSILQHSDSSIPTDTAKAIVARERKACSAVTDICQRQVANLKRQVAILSPPRLKLFARGDFGVPEKAALLDGSLVAEVGLAAKVELPLVGTAYVYLSRRQPLIGQEVVSHHLGIQKDFRIF